MRRFLIVTTVVCSLIIGLACAVVVGLVAFGLVNLGFLIYNEGVFASWYIIGVKAVCTVLFGGLAGIWGFVYSYNEIYKNLMPADNRHGNQAVKEK